MRISVFFYYDDIHENLFYDEHHKILISENKILDLNPQDPISDLLLMSNTYDFEVGVLNINNLIEKGDFEYIGAISQFGNGRLKFYKDRISDESYYYELGIDNVPEGYVIERESSESRILISITYPTGELITYKFSDTGIQKPLSDLKYQIRENSIGNKFLIIEDEFIIDLKMKNSPRSSGDQPLRLDNWGLEDYFEFVEPTLH